jgi:alanyl-tRNA synthetase
VVLGAESSGKAQLIVKMTKDLSGRYHAGKIVKSAATEVGGSGGGRPDMAQAGGTQPENLPAALKKAREVISQVD